MSHSDTNIAGYLAEYDDVDTLKSACETVRDAGYTHWESYTPCPIHGLDAAMGHKPTHLPWVSLLGGLTGLTLGLLLTWYANATSFDVPYAIRGYEFNVSGKPYYSLAAFIPPIFELTILFSAFGAFFGMIAMNMLPRFNHPVFESMRFTRATDDKFFVMIDATDEKFDAADSKSLLEGTNPASLEELAETS